MIPGRNIISLVVGLLALFVFTTFFIPAKVLLELTRVVDVSIAFAVMFSYYRVAKQAFLDRDHLSSGDILAIAIFLSASAYFIRGWWVLAWRLSGQPAWMINSDVTAFTVALSGLASMFFLAAPRAIEGHVPPKNRLVIGSALGVALLMFGLIFVYNVDLSGLAESVRPWFEDDQGSTNYEMM